ncbi:hypothetical protein [Ureibacillus aquaedulcis]|uniref:Uncharacterized protein n=1 Tax=Ureibacillus aquaedulcis TaxID=3058421 RepID=A0ABT8GNU1_9BACL|nr:hypothetical protein [Ureibacillus sp. BA0131]MDN4492961.1 hypothetical protein [Ureibacillus sp. BA0131]
MKKLWKSVVPASALLLMLAGCAEDTEEVPATNVEPDIEDIETNDETDENEVPANNEEIPTNEESDVNVLEEDDGYTAPNSEDSTDGASTGSNK